MELYLANVVQKVVVHEALVFAKEEYARVGKEASDNDEIVQIRTRHFYVSRNERVS